MASIDPRYGGTRIIHKHMAFSAAVAATTLVTALATGVTLIPVHFRWAASNAGSVFLTVGSGGASIWRGAFLANNENQDTAWWDTSITAATAIEIAVLSAVGQGEFDIWFTAVRGGAGAGALVQ